jgi:hypothetical protein
MTPERLSELRSRATTPPGRTPAVCSPVILELIAEIDRLLEQRTMCIDSLKKCRNELISAINQFSHLGWRTNSLGKALDAANAAIELCEE